MAFVEGTKGIVVNSLGFDETSQNSADEADSISAVDQKDSTQEQEEEKNWKSLCFVLCLTGFLLSFKPSEPFLTPYFAQVKGLTNAQINEEVYPIWTYAYFSFLIPVGILAETVGSKYVVVAGILSREATRLILIFANGVFGMQMTQISFGFATATEIIFFSYVYEVVPEKHYQQATGYLRASVQIGLVFGGLFGQLLVSVFDIHLTVLFYISLTSVSGAAVAFYFMPNPKKKVKIKRCTECLPCSRTLRNTKHMAQDFLQSYKSRRVFIWSLWWWTGYAVLELVLNYDTSLFFEVNSEVDYNGAVLAAGKLAACFGALAPHPLYKLITAHQFLVISLVSGISGILLFMSTRTSDIYLVYVLFILFYGVMEFLVSSSSARIAKGMATERFAVVFAFNTFLALFVQTIVQLTFSGLSFDIYRKYVEFAVQMFGVSVLFGAIGLFYIFGCLKYTRNSYESDEDRKIDETKLVDSRHLEDSYDASQHSPRIDFDGAGSRICNEDVETQKTISTDMRPSIILKQVV